MLHCRSKEGAPDLAFVLSGVISVARPRAVQGRSFFPARAIVPRVCAVKLQDLSASVAEYPTTYYPRLGGKERTKFCACCSPAPAPLWSARCASVKRAASLGRSQVVRQRILIPPFPGSSPGAPAISSFADVHGSSPMCASVLKYR